MADLEPVYKAINSGQGYENLLKFEDKGNKIIYFANEVLDGKLGESVHII